MDGIRGKFSDDLILNNNLYDLTLSHNSLSGKIPKKQYSNVNGLI